ncbi:AMP-binding enzyme domain-containing protein [Sarocladium implicatum]|nr:AMP-binding enzyme domain-containing protein [Sarocladium implicatum]
MPIDSRFSVDIPRCSIQKWIFGSSSGSLSDSKAWIDPDDPACYLSLSDARLLAKRIAVGLKDHGAQTGDRVLIFSGNSIYFPAIVLGIWLAGCVFTGASPAYTARELAFQLEDSKASVVLTTPENAQTALDAARSCGLSAEDIFLLQRKLDTEAEDFESIPKSTSPRDWTHLIASKSRGHSFDWVEPQRPEDTICTLNYSSGTTGLPKGVEITHYNIVANSIAVETVDELDTRVKPEPAICPSLCVLPMYHAYCQLYYLCNLPRAHTPVYVMSHFDFPKFLSHVTKYRITSVMAVPPILNLIAKHPLAAKADLSSLVSLGSGAAPLAAQTQDAAIRKIGSGGMVRQGWGMSELTSTGMVWDASREISTAVGELIPGNQARLIDVATGEEITEANKPGELWIASPTLMRGYWRNPEATAAAISRDERGTRWFRTGDIFQVDNYGPGALFYLVDRAKELIKVKGFQVAPAELEALLLQRTDIADVAVTGVANGQEEQPRAHVVRAPNTSTTAAEIEDWVAERVARYKRLTGGVVFVDSIPRNPAGKVLRKVLREMARRDNAVKAHL